MARWFRRHAAVRWALPFLLVVSALGQITVEEAQEIFTEGIFIPEIPTDHPEIPTDYPEIAIEYAGTTTDPLISIPETSFGNTSTTDPQRNERMVVYIKPDSVETKDILELFDSGDVLVKTGDKGTIVITDPTENEYEEQEDGEIMRMAARSLRQNLTAEDTLATEAGKFESMKQPIPKWNKSDLKELLYKWNRELDFNLTDIYKINLASVFAKDYDEMKELTDKNLVEDTDMYARSKETAGTEPRDLDTATSDSDQTAEATEEVVNEQILLPLGTTPRPVYTPHAMDVRHNSQQRFAPQYPHQRMIPSSLQRFPAQPVFQPSQRSDTTPSYLLLPRTAPTHNAPETKSEAVLYKTGNGQPSVVLTGTAPRLSVQTQSLPRTAPQRQATLPVPLPASQAVRRPQTSAVAPSNKPTSRPPRRFGDRFGGRFPRPFQKILNMTVGRRQTTEQPPQDFLSSSVSHLPASSQRYPARVRSPNYLRPSTQNSVPQPVTRKQVAAPVNTEFGARIHPFRSEGERNSTTLVRNVETKEQRDIKINQLRSNLVGKLVVIQSVLGEKEKLSKPEEKGKLPTNPFNRRGLPTGLVKPIVPLRLRTTTFSAKSTENATEASDVDVAVTESSWKDKKKYRRPPSFRKGSQKLSAENQIGDAESEASAAPRLSVVISETAQASLSTVSSTETSTQSFDIKDDDLRNSTSSVAIAPHLEETTTLIHTITTSTESTIKTDNNEVASLRAPEVAPPSVETTLPASVASATFTSAAAVVLKLEETRPTLLLNTTERSDDNEVASTAVASEIAVSETTSLSVASSTAKTNHQEALISPHQSVVVSQKVEATTGANTTETDTETRIGQLYTTGPEAAHITKVEASPVFVENATKTSMSLENATETSMSVENATETSMSVENATETSMSVENATETSMSVENATETSMSPNDDKQPNSTRTSIPDLAVPVPSKLADTLPVIASTEDTESSVESAENNPISTYVPDDDFYLKAMIERALQISDEQKVPKETHGDVATGDDAVENQQYPNANLRDFPEDQDSDDILMETSHPFEDDDNMDPDVENADESEDEDEESFNTDSVPSRVDRSVQKTSKMDSNLELSESLSSDLPGHKSASTAVDLARGRFQPITLPNDILTGNEDPVGEGQATEYTTEEQISERTISTDSRQFPVLTRFLKQLIYLV